MPQVLSESKLLIRPLRPDEIPRAVAIHEAAFPDFFLTFLGTDFLKLLYRFYITGAEEIALAAVYRGQIIATLLGTAQPQKFYRSLANKYKWQFALAALRPFFKNPRTLPRLIRALTYRGDYPSPDPGGALLASICVDIPLQNQGIGRRLVAAFEKEIFQRGARFAYLITDRDHNERTRGFYEKLGWQVTVEFATPEGRAKVAYCKFPGGLVGKEG